MTIIKDYKTHIKNIDSFFADFSVLDDVQETFSETVDDTVVFLTDMSAGVLGYHSRFIKNCADKVSQWIVILFNEDEVVYGHLYNALSETGARFEIIVTDSLNNDIIERLGNTSTINRKKILIWSFYPQRGKKTIAEILGKFLPSDYSFEITEGGTPEEGIANSDAANVIIVGKSNEEFRVPVPEGIQPVYIKTYADTNVQLYLKKDRLNPEIMKILPSHLNWTAEKAAEQIYFISTVYELWRCNGINPRLNNDFIMWDEFGLPILTEKLTDDEITQFLSQFNKLERIAEKIMQ